jgi:hypothetical protein
MTKRAWCLAVAVTLSSGCAKVVVDHVPAATAGGKRIAADGVFYALPRTVVVVDVPVEKVEKKAGRYKDYLGFFYPDRLTAGDYIDKSEVEFHLKPATFATRGEPDPDHVYYVKVTGGAVDRTGFLDLTEQGVVKGASAAVTNPAVDIALGGVSLLTGLLTRTVLTGAKPARGGVVVAPFCYDHPADAGDARVWKYLSTDTDPEQAKMLYRNYCDLGKTPPLFTRPFMIPFKVLREGTCALDLAAGPATCPDLPSGGQMLNLPQALQSLEDLNDARQAYGAIESLKSNRTTILRNPPLGVEFAAKELDKLIAGATGAAFTGSSQKELVWTGTLDVVAPRKWDESVGPLLKFSASGGVCWYDSHLLKGRPKPPAGATNSQNCSDAAEVKLKFERDQRDDTLARIVANYKTQAERAESNERAFRYRVPGQARLLLQWGNSTESEGRAAVAQLGEVFSLPSRPGGRSAAYELAFYEGSGALKSFKLESKAGLQKADIDALAGSANALLDARLKQEQAAEQAADELTRLERRRKLLEEEVKIREACATLGAGPDCGGKP